MAFSLFSENIRRPKKPCPLFSHFHSYSLRIFFLFYIIFYRPKGSHYLHHKHRAWHQLHSWSWVFSQACREFHTDCKRCNALRALHRTWHQLHSWSWVLSQACREFHTDSRGCHARLHSRMTELHGFRYHDDPRWAYTEACI